MDDLGQSIEQFVADNWVVIAPFGVFILAGLLLFLFLLDQ